MSKRHSNLPAPFRPRKALTRRTVAKLLGAGAATLLIERCAPIVRAREYDAASHVSDLSPIDRSLGDLAPRAFSGEQPERAHRALWDERAFLAAHGGAPSRPAERVPLVVVGGGLAGLAAAHALRAHRPVVLEQAQRFGGNSRGEAWRGIDYAIGAAYFLEPDAGSEIASFIGELGLAKEYRLKEGEDPVVLAGTRYATFWDGDSDPTRRVPFRALKRYFTETLEGTGGRLYPDIPTADPAVRRFVDELDTTTFLSHLESVAGTPLHPHVATALEHYCWSSFGASGTEISAAAGLNFYAAEFGNLCVLPGGNAAVAERLVERLARALPDGSLRAGSLVIDVRVTDAGVVVTYEDATGELRSVHARAAVLACPKFVAGRILRDLEPARAAAIGRLRYHAYLVANVLLRRSLPDSFYDLFLAGDGHDDLGKVEAAADRQRVTDVVLGTYARAGGPRSVLTLYRGMPYQAGRGKVFADDAYARYRAEFEQQVTGEILPMLGLSADEVVDLRVARWGHPLPVAAAGLISEHVVDTLRAPFRDRVFFVQQDNWALPAFETSISEALTWAPRIAALLRS